MRAVEEIKKKEIDWDKTIMVEMSLKDLQILYDAVDITDIYSLQEESSYGLYTYEYRDEDNRPIKFEDLSNLLDELREVVRDLGGVV